MKTPQRQKNAPGERWREAPGVTRRRRLFGVALLSVLQGARMMRSTAYAPNTIVYYFA